MVNQFHLLKKSGIERLAIPKANGRVICNACDVHKADVTLKGKIGHLGLKLLAFLNLLELIPESHLGFPKRMEGFDLDEWLKFLGNEKGFDVSHAALAFSPKLSEKRIIALLLNQRGGKIGYAKVSRDDYTDHQFDNEIAGINIINEKGFFFKTPEILVHGTLGSHRYLILQPISTSFMIMNDHKNKICERILHDLTSTSFDAKLNTCTWWDRLITTSEKVKPIVEYLVKNQDRTIPVSMTHGDFGPGNVLVSGHNVFLLDWEEFTPDAPRYTDWFTFLLPFARIKGKNKTELEIQYDKTYNKIRAMYPSVSHFDLLSSVALLSIQRNWIVPNETSTLLSEIIINKCMGAK